MIRQKITSVVRLVTCFLFLSAVAIQRDAHYLGHSLGEDRSDAMQAPVVTEEDGQTIIIRTREIARDIKGYGGSIPLEITIRDGRIAAIHASVNAETPEFFREVETKVIPRWIGLSVDEAVNAEVDAVSGATLSSNATNATIRRGLRYVMETAVDTDLHTDGVAWFSCKWIAALLIVLTGAIVPLFVRSARYRTLQLILNVVVLGLWSGTFISYSLVVNYLSNGVHLWQSLIVLIMLLVAFVYPLFDRKGHYCMWLCPLGSLQELAGKGCRSKWKISPRILKILNRFREVLWALLMLAMWSGLWFSWMDYELFTAFLFRQASVVVIVLTLLFVALSFVVARPYCRFVCPTGSLFRIVQNSK